MLEVPALKNIRKIKSIGVLTSGGDAPGMNAAIRAIVRYGISQKIEVHGILKGYSGLLEKQIIPMNASSVANIIQRGGTVLKTDRCEAFFKKEVREKAAEILKTASIQALIVIGGDGSFAGAYALEKETGFPVIGVPGTIDNDIPFSENSIGFDTAVNTALQAIDRIRDTASSHDRLFLVEVMGRSSGFIALETGIGGGAETVLLPGKKTSTDKICTTILRGIKRGKTSSIIVVAEGKKAGLSQKIAEDLTRRGFNPRVCILGHTQRGGTPTALDRYLASVLGASAVAYLLAGKSGAMVGVQDNRVALVPFTKIVGKIKMVSSGVLELAQRLAV